MSVHPKCKRRGERESNMTQMQLAIRDRKYREDRLAREANQTAADLAAAKAGRVVIKKPLYDYETCEESYYEYEKVVAAWRHRCKNLIIAAKSSGSWFDWNQDWADKGVLMMQPQTERRVA